MVKARVWTLRKKYEGMVKPDNFKLIEEELPDTLNDGEFLTEALYWSVDPYMRLDQVQRKEGECLFGEQISRVVDSKNSEYPVGSIVRAFTGWRTHTLFSENPMLTKLPLSDDTAVNVIIKIPDMDGLPNSLALSVLGMPGMTAYFGFLEICQPRKGETVLVNGAAGAVGHLVGQIAKIKGCKVVGSAGTDDKCKWLREELAFDEVFNYKRVDLDEALTKAAPEGFDCYFDNVGLDFTSKALKHMKQFGQVSLCGAISEYKTTEPRQGKIRYKETVTKGFENMPTAFIGLFESTNTGKAIVSA